MKSDYFPKVRYRFEKYPVLSQGHFEQFAQTAKYLIQNLPLATPNLPFGSAACISSGVLESNNRQSPNKEVIKLRAIESSHGVLLEHSYDSVGRLLKTVYPDNVYLRYDWGSNNQLTSVHLSNGQNIIYNYRDDGLLDKITYPGGFQFRYEYAIDGRLLKCVYPDHRCVARTYDRRNQLIEVLYANSKYTYEWGDYGLLKGVAFRSHGRVCELPLNKDRLNISLSPNNSSGAAGTEIESSLGVWMYSSEGFLREMTLPDGELLCNHSSTYGIPKTFWSSLGQTVYEYDRNNVLSAVLYPNGMRSVYHHIPKTHIVYLVSTNGVALYQYDREGKLREIRADNGQYALFSYNRHDMVKKVATAQGVMQFRYNGSKLTRIVFSTSVSAELSYEVGGCPNAIRLQKIAKDTLAAIVAFGNTLWQWTALKPSLRLKDQQMKEV